MKQHTRFTILLSSTIILIAIACMPALFNGCPNGLLSETSPKLQKKIALNGTKPMLQPLQLFLK